MFNYNISSLPLQEDNSRNFEKKFHTELQRIEQIAKLPTRYVILNNPISNALAGYYKKGEPMKETINVEAFDLPVLKAYKPGEVSAYVMLSLDENYITLRGKPFTQYDRCVFNGIVSLWEAGNKIITPEMVYRTMSNKSSKDYINPKQIIKIINSIEKMRRLHVTADLSEEMQKRKAVIDGIAISNYVIDTFLLTLNRITITAGGTTKSAYEFVQEPALLNYSKTTKQILTVPSKLLDIRRIDKRGNITTSISTTETRQTIKEYLLQRIEVMKNSHQKRHNTQSNRILLNTLLIKTDIGEDNSRTELNRIRQYIYMVFDYWKAVRYIKSYSIIKEKGKIKAFDVEL